MSLTSHVQQAYEDQYKSDQSEWREIGARQKALNIVEVTQGMTFQKVLEVGAGDGSILQFLSQFNFAESLSAVEISGSALARISQRNIPQLRQAVLFDGYTIPFADDSFDLVILSHVLEHVEFERRLLRELQRVARYQVIEVPKDYRFGVDKKVKHFLSYGHINLYTPSSLRFLLKSEGFTILRQKVSIYSRKTYQYMAAGTANKKSFKADLLYFAKKFFVTLPVEKVRDHFANTITVFTSRQENYVRIFDVSPEKVQKPGF
jgi:ubiquinone/menaquinone biosynthesis C-methylase UbiE